jgi:cobalt/nickel transport system permease protein
MNLIYSSIFVLLATAGRIYTAQDARLGYAGLVSGYRSLGTLFSAVFARACKRSHELYTAMEARGYDGEISVLEETFPTSFKSYLAAAGLNAALILGWLCLNRYC